MQEMNLMRLSTPDHPATGSSAILPTQTSRDIARIVVVPQAGNAQNITCTVTDEKVEALVENQVACQNGGGGIY